MIKVFGIPCLITTSVLAILFLLFGFGASFFAIQSNTVEPLPPSVEESFGCAFSWANEPLPDLTADVQAAMDIRGVPDSIVTATAFGEDCTTSDGVTTFNAMETDFTVSVPVQDLDDVDALADAADQVIAVLYTFPQEDTPGPLAGWHTITLVHPSGDAVVLYFQETTMRLAHEDSLTGLALLEALGYIE